MTIAFHAIARTDFPAMIAWNRAPHALPWFAVSPGTVDEAEAEFGPCIDGADPTRVHIVEIDGVRVGYMQHYRVDDNPDYLTGVGHAGAAAIDFIIGDPAYVGRGLGARVLRAYVEDVVRAAYPDIREIISSPDPQNERSLRTLERVGFQRERVVNVCGEAELVCVLRL